MKKYFFICFAIAIVAAIFVSGRAGAQSVPTTVVISVVPNAPSDLTVSPNSSSQVGLSWTNNAVGADDISIERKTGAGGTYAVIAITTPNIATYLDNSVAASTIYFYRVQAITGGLGSAYSGEASVSTPVSPGGGNNNNGNNGGSGGGGGGGGGGGSVGVYIPTPSVSPTNVTVSGSAYPASQVFVLKDGQLAVQTIAGPDANFSATVGNLSAGTYNFSIYSEDSTGLRSTIFSFPVTVTTGATTMISGVFLSPTISVDKQEVKQGDTLTIFGESIPSSSITIQVNSDQTVFGHTTSSASGAYLYELDTSVLAMGSHSTKSKVEAGSLISQESVVQAFTVGTSDIAAAPIATAPAKGDFSGDGKVNLIDFSILGYWYGRQDAPTAYHLDGDATIDLKDFSIMAYYWTG